MSYESQILFNSGVKKSNSMFFMNEEMISDIKCSNAKNCILKCVIN